MNIIVMSFIVVFIILTCVTVVAIVNYANEDKISLCYKYGDIEEERFNKIENTHNILCKNNLGIKVAA